MATRILTRTSSLPSVYIRSIALHRLKLDGKYVPVKELYSFPNFSLKKIVSGNKSGLSTRLYMPSSENFAAGLTRFPLV